ncbi:MAG TPA: hypothetical protein VND54_03190 [Candidatus Saccharimonadales bacterium]|nr:hypothetical protein [Candidatus Saccharimonadales bacterium]
MGVEPPGQPPGNRWLIAAAFAVLIAATGTAGAIVAALQRPPISGPPDATPLPTPFPFPTVAPTPVPSGPVDGFGFGVADDPATHRVIVFGGVDSYDTTWLWDGGRWTLAHPRSSPPGRFGAAMAYDAATRTVMLFGGRLGPGQVVNDTWGWNGTAWRELDDGVNGPPPGEFALMAWDTTRAEMVLVTRTETAAGGETWTWTGNHWMRDERGDLVLDPIAGAMSYDPVSRALLLVSPEPPDGAHSRTLRWDGSAWRVVITGGPAVGGLALDPHVGALVLFGATTYSTAFAVRADGWQWTGSDWLPLSGAAPPVAVEALVEDGDRSQILMFGSISSPTQGNPQPIRIWSWDSVEWVPLG